MPKTGLVRISLQGEKSQRGEKKARVRAGKQQESKHLKQRTTVNYVTEIRVWCDLPTMIASKRSGTTRLE
jgi:hypothetical protein